MAISKVKALNGIKKDISIISEKHSVRFFSIMTDKYSWG